MSASWAFRLTEELKTDETYRELRSPLRLCASASKPFPNHRFVRVGTVTPDLSL